MMGGRRKVGGRALGRWTGGGREDYGVRTLHVSLQESVQEQCFAIL